MSGGAEYEERAYVYMVRCAGGQLYTGWTNDPGARNGKERICPGCRWRPARMR